MKSLALFLASLEAAYNFLRLKYPRNLHWPEPDLCRTHVAYSSANSYQRHHLYSPRHAFRAGAAIASVAMDEIMNIGLFMGSI